MKLGVVIHVRDATGLIHRLDGERPKCGAILEEPVRRLAEIPPDCAEDALCGCCWPRWPGDCLDALLS